MYKDGFTAGGPRRARRMAAADRRGSEALREIHRSSAWEHARRLVASVYGATQPWAAAPPDAVQALRRASVAAAVSLLEAGAEPASAAGSAALDASRTALREVARQARLCRLAGHLPEAAERDLLAEQAAAEAALARESAAGGPPI